MCASIYGDVLIFFTETSNCETSIIKLRPDKNKTHRHPSRAPAACPTWPWTSSGSRDSRWSTGQKISWASQSQRRDSARRAVPGHGLGDSRGIKADSNRRAGRAKISMIFAAQDFEVKLCYKAKRRFRRLYMRFSGQIINAATSSRHAISCQFGIFSISWLIKSVIDFLRLPPIRILQNPVQET